MDVVIPVAMIIGMLALRVFFGHYIGRAAQRRNCGYIGWTVVSLFIGPLIVWIVYLIFVHWKPTLDKIPDLKVNEQ